MNKTLTTVASMIVIVTSILSVNILVEVEDNTKAIACHLLNANQPNPEQSRLDCILDN